MSTKVCSPHCRIVAPGAGQEGKAEAKAKYVPKISRNEYGTPVLDYVFAEVHNIAQHHLLCYVNTDIILLSDFIEAIQPYAEDRAWIKPAQAIHHAHSGAKQYCEQHMINESHEVYYA